MGYYSYFDLEIRYVDTLTPVDADTRNVLADSIAKDCEYDLVDAESLFCENIKWYNYEEDMKKTSKRYPEYIFSIRRDGESRDDISKTHFWNGKFVEESPKVAWEDYDIIKRELKCNIT